MLTPSIIGWCILFLLSVWDLVAVLPSFGPLRVILKMLDKRGQEIPNVFVYSTFIHWKRDNKTQEAEERPFLNINSNNNNNNEIRQVNQTKRKYDEENSPKLGIGDFVFIVYL